MFSELKTLECDILNPDLLLNLGKNDENLPVHMYSGRQV